MFARMLLDVIRKHKLESRSIMQSFDFRTLHAMKRLAPNIRLAALWEGDARPFVDIAREGEVEDRAIFVEGDLFTADIGAATVVTLWLSRSVNAQLEPKLRRELRPGTRIVSRQFPIGTWTPDRTVRVEHEDLFLWTIPIRPLQ